MKKSASFLLGLFLGLIMATVMKNWRTPIERIERDTLVVHDTLIFEKPVVRDCTVVRHDTVRMAIAREPIERIDTFLDSVAVEIPIVQKKYEDSMYTAWVSGYNPSLDSLRIYPPTYYITETVYKKQRRWGVGAMAGVGFGARSLKVEPYIGVGIYYRIW